MKRVGFLWENIVDIDTILVAMQCAAKGKTKRGDVKRVLKEKEKYAKKIQEMLVSWSFEPTPYKVASIRDGSKNKERTIYKPRYYPDQIIHWAVYLSIAPVVYRGMYEFCCGSVPKRGVHYGKKFIERWMRSDRKNTKYYLQLDITKFYPSIKIPILLEKLRRKIKDEKALKLIEKILSQLEELPIGILLSQTFANFYLEEFDHWLKEKEKVKYYVRYMDDMLIFGANKKKLHETRKRITERLDAIGLKLKDNWQLRRTDKEPPDIMGFRFYRTHTKLRKSLMHRMIRRINRINHKSSLSRKDASAIISYLGWIKNSDSHWLYTERIAPYVDISYCKKVIRRASRCELNMASSTPGRPNRRESLEELSG